jgi:DNA-binding CsgD family transcriptional regulator
MPIPMSTSQQRLLRLLAMGTTDSEIARKMALDPDQLQKAFSGLCAQLNVADRVELILLIWSSRGRQKRKMVGILSWLSPPGESPQEELGLDPEGSFPRLLRWIGSTRMGGARHPRRGTGRQRC